MLFLLPIVAAVLWGLHYLLSERVMQDINPSTFWLLAGLVQVAIAAGTFVFGAEPLQLKALWTVPNLFWLVVITILAGVIAEAATVYGIAYNGAAYAAFGELAYPLFIVLFGFLIYGQARLSPLEMLGGVLIIGGAALMTLGKA